MKKIDWNKILGKALAYFIIGAIIGGTIAAVAFAIMG